MKCVWCNQVGHEDCSPRLTFDELLHKVLVTEGMVRKLLKKACEDDRALAFEYGGSNEWDPIERGYGLYWISLEEDDA